MKKILLLLLAGALLAACSASSDRKTETEQGQKTDTLQNKRLATESFIKGAMADLKEQYADAILEYQDALKYDSSAGIYFSLSRDYFKINKLSLALQNIKEAIRLETGNIEFINLLATIYSASSQNDSAAFYFEKIISMDSTNAQAYFNLGQIYESQKPLRALEVYNKLLKIVGPEWSVLVRIADINERLGNVDETIKTVEELLKLNPSSLDLQKMLIESYIKTGKYDNALSQINDSMILFPDDVNLIQYKASVLVQKGNYKEGADEFRKIIAMPQIPFESKMRIGGLFLAAVEKDSSNLQIARGIFEKLDKDTSDWQIKVYLGEIALQEKNDSTAVKYFKDATTLAEWNVQIWVRLGGVLFDSGKYKEAIKFLSEAVDKFPNEFAINLIYGLALSQDNSNDKAKIYLKKALNINPNDPTVLSSYGYTLYQLGENAEAAKNLERAMNLSPDNVQVMGMLGLIYENQKMWDKSDPIYERALAIDSTYATILNNYAFSLAERGLELDRALKMSQSAVEQEPENSAYLDTIGWVYFKLANYTKAKEYIERALEYETASPALTDHLGDVYFKLGDKDKALELWKKAFQFDSSKEEIKQKIERGTL